MAKWKSFVRRKKLTIRQKKHVAERIPVLMDRGYPQKQAVAIAHSEARKKYPRR